MADQGVPIETIPAVQDALEDQRQALDENTRPVSLAVKLGLDPYRPGAENDLDLIEQFKNECRKLGTLDAVCAHGITQSVMARRLGQSE